MPDPRGGINGLNRENPGVSKLQTWRQENFLGNGQFFRRARRERKPGEDQNHAKRLVYFHLTFPISDLNTYQNLRPLQKPSSVVAVACDCRAFSNPQSSALAERRYNVLHFLL